MIKIRHTVSVLLSATLILLSVHSTAQVVDISDCRALEDRLERFDCFERLGTEAADTSNAAGTTINSGSTTNSGNTANSGAGARPPVFNPGGLPVVRRPVNTSITQPEAPAQKAPEAAETAAQGSDVALFGKQGDSNARTVTNEDGKTEMYDTIASLKLRRKNLWLITLESGQQWLQMESKRYPLQAGDEVRIYPTIWGNSYRLTTSRLNGYIQVKRVDQGTAP